MSKLHLTRETVLRLTDDESQQASGGAKNTVTCVHCDTIYTNFGCPGATLDSRCLSTVGPNTTTTIIIQQ